MWRFVVTDTDGNALGELAEDVTERQLTRRLRAPASLSFKTAVDHPLAADLLDLGRTLVRAYRHDDLIFHGELALFEEEVQGAGSKVAFTAFDAAWRLGQVYIGKSAAGYSAGSASSPIDLATLMADTFSAADILFMPHGITWDSGSMSSSAYGYIDKWFYKSLLEAISELSETLDGFDWRILPHIPAGNEPGSPIGEFICADSLGSFQENAIFEYGWGKHNVSSYRRTGNADALLNAAYSLPSGFPDATPGQTVQSTSDAASQALYGVREGVVDSDLAVDQLRLQLIQEHVRLRKVPRQTITFEPAAVDDPAYGDDYDLGDVVVFRAAHNGEKRIDVQQRIYGVSFSIDGEGNEQKTLTLAPE